MNRCVMKLAAGFCHVKKETQKRSIIELYIVYNVTNFSRAESIIKLLKHIPTYVCTVLRYRLNTCALHSRSWIHLGYLHTFLLKGFYMMKYLLFSQFHSGMYIHYSNCYFYYSHKMFHWLHLFQGVRLMFIQEYRVHKDSVSSGAKSNLPPYTKKFTIWF